MEVKGRLIQKVPAVTGPSRNGGEWKRQDIIIEVENGQYPRKVCITIWNDRAVDVNALPDNCTITASVEIESREFNGKWYTSVTALKVEVEGAQASAPISAPIPAEPPAQSADATWDDGASLNSDTVPPF